MDETPIPRLRIHRRKDKDGNPVTYYFWDGRGRGMPDVPLGRDREKAMERWGQCEQGIFPQKGVRPRDLTKRLPGRVQGQRRKINSDDWLKAEPWMRTMFFNAERRALSAGKSFTLTPADFLALIKRASGYCEISGLPFEPVADRSPFAPSMDRIECSRGYEPGNVRLVCHVVNVALNTWGLDPLLRVSEALMRKHGGSFLAKTVPQTPLTEKTA